MKELLLSIAVLLPALALLGYYQGGQRALVAVQDPAWLARNFSPEHDGTPAQNAVLLDERARTLAFLAVALAATLSARAFRQWREHRVGSIRLTYPDRTIRVARGFSVLEASLINNIPHAHVCGGRGRCSTCRVRVRAALPGPPPPSDDERRVLNRIRATANVRLACMLRPDIDVEVTPLLPPFAQARDGRTLVRAGTCRNRGVTTAGTGWPPRDAKGGRPCPRASSMSASMYR